MSDKKITYISLMQIIGPIFVVLGHSLNGLDVTGWWHTFSKDWIYIFHMPLFFLVSGYLLSHRGYLGKRTYGGFVLGKFKRLLIPYLVWNALFWIPKFLFGSFLADDTSLDMLGMLRAFVYPRQNVWGHTWFLLGLFLVYLASPVFFKLFGAKKWWLNAITLVLCTGLYIVHIGTELLAFSDLHKDLLFFVIGCLLGQVETERFIAGMKKLRIPLILGAVVTSVPALMWYSWTKPYHFIPCALILLAFLSLFVSVRNLPPQLEKLASYSFGIYIMHWPVMIMVRIALHQILHLNAGITAAIMSVCGYLVPILVIVVIRALPFEKLKRPLKYLLGV